MKTRFPPLVALAIIVYCGWNSSGLISDWQHDPLAASSWIILLFWLNPAVVSRIAGTPLSIPTAYCNTTLLTLALMVSLLGVMGSLNALKYASFAIAIGGLLPWSWGSCLWILSALSWMPALGWLGAHTSPSAILPMRFTFVVLGTSAALAALAYNKRGQTHG